MNSTHQQPSPTLPLSSAPAIEARKLTRRFGTFVAVDHIDFSIEPGEVVAFLGPNGAGKTTTIKMFTGLLRPTEGEALLFGHNVQECPGLIKTFIGYMSQRFTLYPLLTAAENIEFFAGIVGLRPKEIRKKIEKLAALLPPGFLHRKAQALPPGIKQEVALFACLLSDPKIIFLDEPTSGVAPERRRDFWMRIYELKREGKTVLVSTHNLDEAEYADRLVIIHQGKIRFQGELASLAAREGVSTLEEFFLKLGAP